MNKLAPITLLLALSACSEGSAGRPVLGADREHALVIVNFPDDETTGDARILSVDLEEGRLNHTVYTDQSSEPEAYWTSWGSDGDINTGRSLTTASRVDQYLAESESPGSGEPSHLYSLVMPGGDDLLVRLAANGDYSEETQEFTAFFIGLWDKYPEP